MTLGQEIELYNPSNISVEFSSETGEEEGKWIAGLDGFYTIDINKPVDTQGNILTNAVVEAVYMGDTLVFVDVTETAYKVTLEALSAFAGRVCFSVH